MARKTDAETAGNGFGRRDFLKGAAAGAATLVAARAGGNALMKGATGGAAGAAALLATGAGKALANGVAAYTLTVGEVTWDAGGGTWVNAYAYSIDGGATPSIPGPTLRAQAGDTFQITVQNNLSDFTTVHWHGVHPIPNNMDGVALGAFGLPTPIPSGGSFVYRFPAPSPGTYVYHTHHDTPNQLPRGLYGLLVVDDPVPGIRSAIPRGQRAHERRYDREFPLVLGTFPASIRQSGSGNIELINGKTFYGLGAVSHPAMQDRLIFNVQRGERILFRVWNGSNAVHPMHTHGMSYVVVAADGMDLEMPVHRHNLGVNAGEAYDIIVHAETPGVWLLHCHNLAHVSQGMIAVLIVS